MNNELGAAMAKAEVSTDEHEPLSPGRGAFVIQFRTSVDVGQGRFTGRGEHVASGEVGHFQTPDELAAFVTRVLSGLRDEP